MSFNLPLHQPMKHLQVSTDILSIFDASSTYNTHHNPNYNNNQSLAYMENNELKILKVPGQLLLKLDD